MRRISQMSPVVARADPVKFLELLAEMGEILITDPVRGFIYLQLRIAKQHLHPFQPP
ncbi:hypothetical protein D3C86_2140890 [compost metagenome]